MMPLTTPRYDSWLKGCYRHTFNVIEGAIRSGKSVQAVRAFANLIMACPVQRDALFLACAVSVSMAKALIGECAGFGLRYIFGRAAHYCQYRNRDAMRIAYRINGAEYTRWVIFVGGAKAGCEAAIRGLSIQGAHLEEGNLLTEDFVNEVQNRMANAPRRFMIVTLNPSMSSHWIYRDFIDSAYRGVPSGRMNYLHTTLRDNPAMTPEAIKDVESSYDPDSVWYKGYILGERMNPAGAIYHVKDENVIDAFDPNGYRAYVVVCDQGETISATAITLGALRYDPAKGFYTYDVLKEYHHVNAASGIGEQKHFEDYAKDLAEFVKEAKRMFGYDPFEVVVDEDPEFYHQACVAFSAAGLDPYSIKFPYKLTIEERVKRGVGLMHKGQLRFYKGCKSTIDDFRNAEYDQKEIERKGEFVRAKTYTEGFGHLDMVDSVEYGFTRFLTYLSPDF